MLKITVSLRRFFWVPTAYAGSLGCGPWARHICPSLGLFQPRKTRAFLTERLLMAHKESNQTTKQNPQHMFWMSNKENSFTVHTLIWRPGLIWCNVITLITVNPVLSGHSKRKKKRRQKIGFQDRLLFNAGQKYCRMLPLEHSAILSTYIKLPFVVFCLFWVAA